MASQLGINYENKTDIELKEIIENKIGNLRTKRKLKNSQVFISFFNR